MSAAASNVVQLVPIVTPYAERLLDALDLAQSCLDEAEQLFCAGHEDAGQDCVTAAIRALESVK